MKSRLCKHCGWWAANWRHQPVENPEQHRFEIEEAAPRETPRRPSIHASSIAIVARRDNWQTVGFREAARQATGCGRCGECEWCDVIPEAIKGFLPDLYRIERHPAEDGDDPAVTIWVGELEDSHSITADKMEALENFWFVLDSYSADWRARLVVYDRYGTTPREIDLGERWFAEMYREHARA